MENNFFGFDNKCFVKFSSLPSWWKTARPRETPAAAHRSTCHLSAEFFCDTPALESLRTRRPAFRRPAASARTWQAGSGLRNRSTGWCRWWQCRQGTWHCAWPGPSWSMTYKQEYIRSDRWSYNQKNVLVVERTYRCRRFKLNMYLIVHKIQKMCAIQVINKMFIKVSKHSEKEFR